MSRFRRQHEAHNISPVLHWLLGLCMLTLIVMKIVSCNQSVNRIHEYEKQKTDTILYIPAPSLNSTAQ